MEDNSYASVYRRRPMDIRGKPNDKGIVDISKNGSYPKEKMVDSNEEEYFIAAAKGNLKTLLILLSKSVSIDTVNSKKQTGLIISCISGQLDTVRFLVAKKASVEICDETGYSVLHHACMIEHIEILNFFLDKVNPNFKDQFGQTILHLAVQKEKYDTLKVLIHSPKIDFNKQDSEGNTAVHIAVVKRNIKILVTLLTVDVDLSICNKDGMNPINLSVHSNDLEILKIFANSKQGINALYLTSRFNETNLQIAIRSNFANVVDYLLNLKDTQIVNGEIDNQDGLTCIHWAALQNNQDLICAILDINPMIVNVKDGNGCTVLEQVISNYETSKSNQKCLIDIAIKLICRNADIDLVSNRKGLQNMLKDIFETRLHS